MGVLTPKIGTGKRLTCEVFLKAFGKGVCGREYIVIR
jgi:hypothetical protein